MSIVKMKRLRLIGMQADKDVLLRRLMGLGCVELTTMPQEEQGTKPEQADLLILQRERLERLHRALGILKKHVKEKGGLFAEKDLVSHAVFFGDEIIDPALALADELIVKEERIDRLRAVISRARASRAALLPWKDLDVPLDTQGTEHVAVFFGTVPASTEFAQVEETLSDTAPESAIYRVGESREGICLMVVCHRAVFECVMETLRQAGFAEVNFPEFEAAPTSMAALSEELDGATVELKDLKAEIAALAERRSELRLCADRLAQEVAIEEAKQKLRGSESTFALEGWFSVPQEPELAAVLDEFSCTWEQSDPDPSEYEEVPVKLKGNKLTEPLNMVTEMYGLPAYDGIDPNGLIMPFFAVFFGIMYADLGYGLVLTLLALFMRRKRLSRGMKHAAGLLLQVGITTAIFGAIFGGFFGDVIPVFSETFLARRLDMWSLFDPMADPIMLMVGAIALGAFQIIVGMCVRVYLCFRDGRPWDALFDVGTWWLLFVGIAVLALGYGPWVAVAGALAVMFGQGRGNPFKGLGKLYNITSYLSDVLSYIRLMALFLATGVIASVFNMLGSMLGESLGIFGIVGFIAVFLIGHAFNMGLNIIGTFVHAVRLQYLEFFGKFYKEGGRPFKPLSIHTKYYDITE